jgi:ubiquinone/menaquinone biosynthesis C-methylase UbiE
MRKNIIKTEEVQYPHTPSKLEVDRHYNRLSQEYDLLQETPREVLSHIQEELRHNTAEGFILDCGSGTGLLSKGLSVAEGLERDSFISIDRSLHMCIHAKNKGVNAVCGDFGKVPLGDNTVGAAIFIESIHHRQSDRVLIKELQRILTHNSIVIVAKQVGGISSQAIY